MGNIKGKGAVLGLTTLDPNNPMNPMTDKYAKNLL